MNLSYLAPIVLLFVSNIFMTFAWVRSGSPQANEMVRGTISSDERRDPQRADGGLSKSAPARKFRGIS